MDLHYELEITFCCFKSLKFGIICVAAQSGLSQLCNQQCSLYSLGHQHCYSPVTNFFNFYEVLFSQDWCQAGKNELDRSCALQALLFFLPFFCHTYTDGPQMPGVKFFLQDFLSVLVALSIFYFVSHLAQRIIFMSYSSLYEFTLSIYYPHPPNPEISGVYRLFAEQIVFSLVFFGYSFLLRHGHHQCMWSKADLTTVGTHSLQVFPSLC